MNGVNDAEKTVDKTVNDDAVNRSVGNFCSHWSPPFEYCSIKTQQQQQQYIISTDAVIRPYSRNGLTLHTSQSRVQPPSSVKSICENRSMYYRVRSTVEVSMPEDCNEATGRNCTDRPPSHLTAPSSCNAPFYSKLLLYSAPEKCFGLLHRGQSCRSATRQ